jgi:hypothetical protein
MTRATARGYRVRAAHMSGDELPDGALRRPRRPPDRVPDLAMGGGVI